MVNCIVDILFRCSISFPGFQSYTDLSTLTSQAEGKMKGYETKSSDQTDLHMCWWLRGDGYTELAVHCSSICNNNRVGN